MDWVTTWKKSVNIISRRAEFSACGRYRYLLERTLEPQLGQKPGNRVLFCMLNPSLANAEGDDPTLRRCMGFAHAWGYDQVAVVNLYALVSTDPAGLLSANDPVGPGNDAAIQAQLQRADLIVCAWGNNSPNSERTRHVMAMLQTGRADVTCLRVTKTGNPEHPLRLPATLVPQAFSGSQPA